VVSDTQLVLAIRVIDYQGGGGLYGDEQALCIRRAGDGRRTALAGVWKYLPVAEYRGDRFAVFGAEGKRYADRPRLPIDMSAHTPTVLYNAMIAPLAPASLAGVIWYQGESNAGRPEQYKTLFPLLIDDWRRAFRRDDLPFLFVQIAPYNYGENVQSEYLREAQMQTLAVEHTGMAVTLDIGDARNIHPANKQEVGRRLGRLALARAYGRPIPCSGPMVRSVVKRGAAAELEFDYAEGGLILRESAGGNGFQVAGADRLFRDAQVVVDGSRLVVRHPDIVDPVAVRYAFTNTPVATFFNGAGLPASSFRTDNWERK
jgi:sialate O-acetylesterase